MTAEDDGRFEIERVTTDEYVLRVSALGFEPHVSDTIVASADESVDLGDVAIGVGGTIYGTVVDGGGAPVEGASVYASRSGPNRPARLGPPARATTDSQGRFEIAGLTGDRYDVHGSAQGAAGDRARDVGVGDSVRLTLKRPGELDIRVVDGASGRAVPQFAIRLLASSTAARQTGVLWWREVADANGRCELDSLDPGEYRLHVRARGYAIANVSATVTDGETTTVRVPMDSGGTITGVVHDAEGSPVAGARVRVEGAAGPDPFPMPSLVTVAQPGASSTGSASGDGSSENFATTDDAGKFELRGVIDGTHTLVVTHSRFLEARRADVPVTSDAARSLDEPIVLSRGAILTGVVRDANGNLVPGAVVGIRLEEPANDRVPTTAELQPILLATDEGAEYERAVLPAGTYSVWANRSGGEAHDAPTTIELSEGEPHALDLIVPED